jgi:hypothetical protein
MDRKKRSPLPEAQQSTPQARFHCPGPMDLVCVCRVDGIYYIYMSTCMYNKYIRILHVIMDHNCLIVFYARCPPAVVIGLCLLHELV